jgi:hypothetical protein
MVGATTPHPRQLALPQPRYTPGTTPSTYFLLLYVDNTPTPTTNTKLRPRTPDRQWTRSRRSSTSAAARRRRPKTTAMAPVTSAPLRVRTHLYLLKLHHKSLCIPNLRTLGRFPLIPCTFLALPNLRHTFSPKVSRAHH